MEDPKKVLIIDSDEHALSSIKNALSKLNVTTQSLTTPLPLINGNHNISPHLIILDTELPELSGFQVCKIAKSCSRLESKPIIFVSKTNDVKSRVNAFEAGAEDFISKPFNPLELELRVNAILRRCYSNKSEEDINSLKAGNMSINFDTRTVSINDNIINLTTTEFNLLWLLIKRKGRVQTRETLLNNVWQYDTELETRTVDTHITRLRGKLKELNGSIDTIRGVGYRFTEPTNN